MLCARLPSTIFSHARAKLLGRKASLMREHKLDDGAAHIRLLRVGREGALGLRLALGLLAMIAAEETPPRLQILVLR
jgi:hypothetical protein